ncbi:uncharacterized protein DS421_4g133700 [Arachis hypogaea]|nr:uncharacterized protein DS421_4g133700 [Arachis hypogaea]
MMSIGVENEQDHLMFKRIFILYIQMAFLFPTTINKISSVYLAPIFKMDKITEGNWGGHVLNFIIKGIANYRLKKKKSIDGCLFALMIIYFHLAKNKDKKGEENPRLPWVSNWNREQLVSMMRAEIDRHMAQSKKRKHVVENSSPEQTQSYDGKKGARLQSIEGHYDSSEIMPEVNLGSENDPLFQGQIDQSSINKLADCMFSLVEESANDPTQQNMMVVQMETHSQPESLSINPAPEDAAKLMMMARTASYIPKEGLMPSFSLGLTDSSQEEALTQEGQGQP